MKRPLPEEVRACMQREADAGLAAWKCGDIVAAEKHFLAAWDAVPEPKLEHEFVQAHAWALTTFYRDTGQYDSAKKWMRTVRLAYLPSPSVDFLEGTVAFDRGDMDTAFRLFHALYLEYGARPFEGRNAKYLDFTLSRLRDEQ